MSAPSPTTASPHAVLTSRSAVALWLRFQCNPAATLHESYREILAAETKPRTSGRREKLAKDSAKAVKDSAKAAKASPKDSDWLQRLWGTAPLSRVVCERFFLRCDPWPQVPSQLPFFLRLVMLDREVLLTLLRSAGLVLSATEIAAVIDHDEVAQLKKRLGEKDYTFAMETGVRLCPSRRRIALRAAKGGGALSLRASPRASPCASLRASLRASLGYSAFHTTVGLRLLLLQGEGVLREQHWRRLALKCPRGIVDLLRRSTGFELEEMGGLDVGTAAGMRVRLVVENEGEASDNEAFWCSLAKEVIGSWHAWLASSKVA